MPLPSDLRYQKNSGRNRSRLTYATLIAVTIILGLASRKFSHFLPWWLAKNAGDVLYAAMAFWLAGFLFPALSPARAALGATAFCIGVEFLKFFQAPWLIAARHTPAGALVLGSGFHGSNLICYMLGAALAFVIEVSFKRTHA